MIDQILIEQAHQRVASHIHNTPILTNSHINDLVGAEVFFKCENFQKTGSFKARGAMNSVLQLSDEQKKKGVATHSSGNHGQALAWAAKMAGVAAYIVMPENAPKVKVAAVKEYGAEVIFCKSTLEARETTLEKVMTEKGCTFIPPYNFDNTICGQATCAKEVFEDLQNVDFLLTPVGGGGLLSGSALSGKYFSPTTKVIGCEPELANDAYESFHSGELQPAKEPITIADGLRTSLGDINFGYIKKHVDDILLCSEEEIVNAQKLIWERMKIIIEPSSAVPVACLLKYKSHFAKAKIAVIISGGNVDLGNLPFS
ncbi:threonine ammonia-lyase [Owenweeksia hongkongensis]|uniref:threonine ammonia-lyase n=1 Tax=Owenweeksia hongkongensis TaxID=253245 RepID=UPI003A8CE757